MKKRKTFSKEFKLEAVRQLEQGDKSPNDIAMDLGIRRNMLYKWQDQIRKQGDGAFNGPDISGTQYGIRNFGICLQPHHKYPVQFSRLFRIVSPD